MAHLNAWNAWLENIKTRGNPLHASHAEWAISPEIGQPLAQSVKVDPMELKLGASNAGLVLFKMLKVLQLVKSAQLESISLVSVYLQMHACPV